MIELLKDVYDFNAMEILQNNPEKTLEMMIDDDFIADIKHHYIKFIDGRKYIQFEGPTSVTAAYAYFHNEISKMKIPHIYDILLKHIMDEHVKHNIEQYKYCYDGDTMRLMEMIPDDGIIFEDFSSAYINLMSIYTNRQIKFQYEFIETEEDKDYKYVHELSVLRIGLLDNDGKIKRIFNIKHILLSIHIPSNENYDNIKNITGGIRFRHIPAYLTPDYKAIREYDYQFDIFMNGRHNEILTLDEKYKSKPIKQTTINK